MHRLSLIHRSLDMDCIFLKQNGNIAIGGLHRIRELEINSLDDSQNTSMV